MVLARNWWSAPSIMGTLAAAVPGGGCHVDGEGRGDAERQRRARGGAGNPAGFLVQDRGDLAAGSQAG
jgi:hypothetical protein